MADPAAHKPEGYRNRIDQLNDELASETDPERRKQLAEEIETVAAMYKTLFTI